MKKNLTSLAMLALLAGFCVSANAPFNGKEIAMSKCSKDNSSDSRRSDTRSTPKSDYDDSDDSECQSCNSCSDQSDASSLMKTKPKAVSEKIVQADK